MPEIIRDGIVVADEWEVLRTERSASSAAPPGTGPLIVPLWRWLEHAPLLAGRADLGVWLAPDEDPLALTPWLTGLPLVAVDFPRFTDGRGYSLAFLLRSRLGFRGELRAIGQVLPDQLFFLRRVGFNAFALRQDQDPRQALRLLKPFSDAYQGAWDMAEPAYRRHRRGWPSPVRVN